MSFSEKIINWYTENKRHLPWRATKDPYKIWLSEIILQQTRVEQGLPYYLKFIKAYPTVFCLANADSDEVLKLWQGLGYYTRARYLQATAKDIANTRNGIFPETYDALVRLKGVGDYTASAIASICFNKPNAVVDGNVYRVLARYFNIDIPIHSGKGISYFKKVAQELLYKEDPSTYNQAIMEFGALQCKPKTPHCTTCPLNSSCAALQKHTVELRPVKIKKNTIKTRFFNYLVITNGQQIILKKRIGKDIWQSLYEFPLIETPKPVGQEEITTHVTFIKHLQQHQDYEVALYNTEAIVHKLSHQHIYTKFWIVTCTDTIENGIAISEIQEYPVSILIATFAKAYDF